MKEAVLSFRLQALQAAEDKAKRVLVAVQKAGDLSKDVKRQITATTRQGIKELRELKAAEIDRLRGIKDRAREFAASLRGPDRSGVALGALRGLNQVREKAGAALSLLNGGVGSISSLASLGGPLAAAAAAVVVPLIQQAVKGIEEAQNAKLDLLKLQIEADLERIAYEGNYERKLAEDPSFARREAFRAFAHTAEELGSPTARDDFLGGF